MPKANHIFKRNLSKTMAKPNLIPNIKLSKTNTRTARGERRKRQGRAASVVLERAFRLPLPLVDQGPLLHLLQLLNL